MIQDIALPIQSFDSSREETFIVFFDGFIKNTSEGIIRTMLRDEEKWNEKYPLLNIFRGMTQDMLYESTMLTMPLELLYELSEEKVTPEEINKDLSIVLPSIILSNSKVTLFEYALHRILEESNVKKCYIIRSTDFYQNEIDYIRQKYESVIDKIEMVSGGFITLFKEVNPTTTFITDHRILSNYMMKNFTREELDKRLFVILNTLYNVRYDNQTNVYIYNEEFSKLMDTYTKNHSFGLTAMYNFQLNSQEVENRVYEEQYGKGLYYPTAEEIDEEIKRLERDGI